MLLLLFLVLSPIILSIFIFPLRHRKVKPAERTCHINIQPAGNAFIVEMMQLIAGKHSDFLTDHIVHPANRTFTIAVDFPRRIFELPEQLERLLSFSLLLTSLVRQVREISKDYYWNH